VSVLVDSSVWIEYFRGSGESGAMDFLIDENLLVTNDLILAELIPGLHVRRHRKLIGLLREVKKNPMNVDWDDLIQMQIVCLRNGINKVGLSDLMIAQHAIRSRLMLYSRDRHFLFMARHLSLRLYQESEL
jgi:predicted nucleic acid-binding protein